MNLQSIQAAEKKLVMQTYARTPVLFVSGEGVHLRDSEGVEYLDLLSGIGVCSLGYNHPAITKAIAEQAGKVLHTSNLFFSEHTAELALRLTDLAGLDRLFLANSGTEAWEAALKLARAHAELLRAEGKHIGSRFLALEHSFHGRTIGSVATTHKLAYRNPFAPVMPGVDFVRFNDIDHLRATFTNDICAICIEPVQGEGGIHPVSREFFAAARELCDSTGALLLADEIQCGFGRTGKWFAYQHFGIQPDITTIAKPIAGGIPMGAMLATEEASRAFTPGMHGTTFGGNPLACAVALAVIDTIQQQNILAQVEDTGTYFRDCLNALAAKHEAIKEVRALGLMIGIDIESPDLATRIVSTMLHDHHIILNRTSDTVLRLLPPYILTREHVDAAIHALDQTMSTLTTLAGTPAGDHANG